MRGGGDGADVLAIERSSAREFCLRLFMAIKALYARLAYDFPSCLRRAKRKVFTIAAFAERRAYSFRFHTRSCLACRNMSPAAHRSLELASIVVRNAGRVGRRGVAILTSAESKSDVFIVAAAARSIQSTHDF